MQAGAHRAPPGLHPGYLALAVLLHAMILAAWPRGGPTLPPLSAAALTLRLLPPRGPDVVPATPATIAEENRHPATVAPPPSGPWRNVPPVVAPPSFPAADAIAPDRIAAARSMLVQESRRQTADPMYRPPPPEAHAATPLERAGTRARPGERMVAEGIVQVTTASGSVFCLQRPPPIANRDGPVTVESMPMSCP